MVYMIAKPFLSICASFLKASIEVIVFETLSKPDEKQIYELSSLKYWAW